MKNNNNKRILQTVMSQQMDNIKEMDKFLEMCNLLKLNEEETI